ncbi:MAG: hypothetical protein H6708_22345 [Kofleriaceae bacterium]|nr:hypothetical protein [Myxococcales bacterium]MCB9563147.1 hypothetical protein [Kofleriaceae bacterium]
MPLIGIQLDARASERLTVRQRLGAFLDGLQAQKLELQVSNQDGVMVIEGSDGFSYRVGGTPKLNAVVQYSFPIAEQRAAGVLPTIAYKPRAYGELLEVASVRTREMIVAMSANGTVVKRLGAVATAQLAEHQLPAGGSAFKSWLEATWQAQGSSLIKTTSSVVVRFPRMPDTKFYEQCHHSFAFDVDADPREYVLMLDYQRVWDESVATSVAMTALDGFLGCACTYFQEFGFPEEQWPPR